MMEERAEYTRERILFWTVIGIVCAVSLFWCVKKSDMFIDEIVTYGLSNSYYAPFISDVPEDRSLINKVLTREDFTEYLTVSEEDAFRFDSVYDNQTRDTQPPLYYMLLHFMCSFFKGQYSKWIGLSINLVLYLGTLILLYHTGNMILRSRKYASLAVLLYGLSFGGLSTVLMIRMYILLTFLTMCFAYVVLSMYQGPVKRRYYPAVGLILFLGLFTQYFFVFFAFFLSAAYCLRELWKRHFKEFLLYAASAFAGIAVFYICYPCVTDQLFADKLVSGQTAAGNLMDFRGMLLSIYSFVMQTAAGYKAALLLLLTALAAGVFRLRRTVQAYAAEFGIKDCTAIAMLAGLMIIPAVFAFSGGDPDTLQAGPSLMFITIPKVFASMGFGTGAGIMFFLLVLLAALTSAISLAESGVSTFEDQLGIGRHKATVLMGIIMILFGSVSALGFGVLDFVKLLGMSILDFFDFLTNSLMMPIAALATCLLVTRVAGLNKIIDEVEQSSEFKRKKMYCFFMKYLAPVCIVIILLSSIANVFGWITM